MYDKIRCWAKSQFEHRALVALLADGRRTTRPKRDKNGKKRSSMPVQSLGQLTGVIQSQIVHLRYRIH